MEFSSHTCPGVSLWQSVWGQIAKWVFTGSYIFVLVILLVSQNSKYSILNLFKKHKWKLIFWLNEIWIAASWMYFLPSSFLFCKKNKPICHSDIVISTVANWFCFHFWTHLQFSEILCLTSHQFAKKYWSCHQINPSGQDIMGIK